MFDFSKRNSGENHLPPTSTDSQIGKDTASRPRPTLEQLVNEVTGRSQDDVTWDKIRGVAPDTVAPMAGYVRRPNIGNPSNSNTVLPAPAVSAPSDPTSQAASRPTPLVYRRPESGPNKLVPQNSPEWRAPSRSENSQPNVNIAPPRPSVPADPCIPLDIMSTAEHHLPEGTIGKMLPTELIYALQAQANHDSIYTKLTSFAKRNAHNPLLELASGTVAFVAKDDAGRIRVYIGSMRDFCLFSRKTNMLEGTLAIEEMFEYEISYGQIVVIRKKAGEIVPSQVAGRRMYPVLEFSSYTESGFGKATCQIRSEWR